jgi:hypothetical protein
MEYRGGRVSLYIITYLTRLDMRSSVEIEAKSAQDAEKIFKKTHSYSDRIQSVRVKND